MKKLVSLLLALSMYLAGCLSLPWQRTDTPHRAVAAPAPLRLLMSEDMQPYESVLQAFASSEKGVAYTITYEGVADIQHILEGEDCPYDAIWLSNSISLHMLSGGQKITNSRFTGISPVIFGMRASLAKQLGFDQKELSMGDLMAAIEQEAFTLTMPSITQDNSGRSAYIAILYALAGSPTVLTSDALHQPDLQNTITHFFSQVNRAAGSEAFVTDTAFENQVDCIVASEGALIRLNNRLEAAGKETYRMLYPSSGITVGDAPLAYIDQGDSHRLDLFLSLQAFVLSTQGQELLAQQGMRTDLGGLIADSHQSIFRQEWGIQPDRYIHTLVYPSSDTLRKSLTLYQEGFKKPTFTVFCLDFSGSMWGDGDQQLKAAMAYILNPETASNDFLQLTEKDQVVLLAYNSHTVEVAAGDGSSSMELYRQLEKQEASGATAMYDALWKAVQLLQKADATSYSLAIINMTDGSPTDEKGHPRLQSYYANPASTPIPIFSIMFGSATERYVTPLAELSGGKVFNGKDDLTKAFREVMGYN